MTEYRLAKGWTYFLYITATIAIGASLWAIISALIPGIGFDINPTSRGITIGLSLVIIAMFGFGLADAAKSRIIIDAEKIRVISLFRDRHILLRDVKGFRIGEKGPIAVESNIGEKSLALSPYLGGYGTIRAWLESEFVNLEQVELEEEYQEIRNDQNFGVTAEERDSQISRAKVAARILNWTGGLIGAWAMFKPVPYQAAVLASMAIPPVSLATIIYFRGLIRMYGKRDAMLPTLPGGLIFPALAVLLRALIDFELFDHAKVWPPVAIATICLTPLILIGAKKSMKTLSDRVSITIVGGLLAAAYSYGSVVVLNCLFDNSAPAEYSATVLKKRISSGKSRSYYLELTPWGPRTKPDEVQVSKSFYNRIDSNAEVGVYVWKGRLNIPWITVSSN
jgi:hypothetical protein